MLRLLVEGGLILVGLIVGRWRALGLPVAVMALYLAQGAISNELGDDSFTGALSDGGNLLVLAGVLGVADCRIVLGVSIRRLASRFAKPS